MLCICAMMIELGNLLANNLAFLGLSTGLSFSAINWKNFIKKEAALGDMRLFISSHLNTKTT
jgi:hypothetical protein